MLGRARARGGCWRIGCWFGGWSLVVAAEAAAVSERTAWKWVDRFRGEGEGWVGGSLLGAGVGAVANAGRPGGADRGFARAALHESGDRGDAGDAAVDRRRCP